jgi:hypothetical protein
MVKEMAARATEAARKLFERLDRWANCEMGDDLFYAYLGILTGRGIITPTIANSARRYWHACQSGDLHAAHAAPNLSNAYQAVSGGLHRVSPTRAFRSFAGADAITDGVALSGGAMTGIPAFTCEIAEY